jgi:hypothetical protein
MSHWVGPSHWEGLQKNVMSGHVGRSPGPSVYRCQDDIGFPTPCCSRPSHSIPQPSQVRLGMDNSTSQRGKRALTLDERIFSSLLSRAASLLTFLHQHPYPALPFFPCTYAWCFIKVLFAWVIVWFPQSSAEIPGEGTLSLLLSSSLALRIVPGT